MLVSLCSLMCSAGLHVNIITAKKMKKKEKKVCLHVGICTDSVQVWLPFLTCGCSKYAESLGFLRSRFKIGGRGDFLNDFKGLLLISGHDRKKML